jgi:hypothetical protein
MKPEEIITNFWQVWQNKPDLLLAPEVEKDLGSLSQKITSLSDTTNADLVAKQIQEWCKKHPSIRDLVCISHKKPKPKKSDDKSVEKTLHNRFPELSQVLQAIANKSQRNG